MNTPARSGAFLSDIKTLRAARAPAHRSRARSRRAIAPIATTVLKLLNEALATEIVCVLRYRRHYFMARASTPKRSRRSFCEHATEEQGHADEIAAAHRAVGRRAEFQPRGPRDAQPRRVRRRRRT